jgi:hypothetical protein
MTKPFVTPNPQDFKLRVVWSVDASSKMVAEFSSCKWLPRIGETLVLPIDETRKSNWRKFKVFDVVYDFQDQVVRVFCSPVNWTPPNAKTLISKAQEPKGSWEFWEQAFEEIEANVTPKSPVSKPIESDFGLEYDLSQIEEDVDDELERLKRKVLD